MDLIQHLVALEGRALGGALAPMPVGPLSLTTTACRFCNSSAVAVAWSLKHHTTPKEINPNPEELKRFQHWLVQHGHR